MQEMMDFAMWWLSELPAFLMAEPVCYLVGFAFLFVTVSLFQRIINIHH